jgi:hypothetical protein
MEHIPCADNCPIKTSMDRGFAIAIFDLRRKIQLVVVILTCERPAMPVLEEGPSQLENNDFFCRSLKRASTNGGV